jgi:hypothetical protein
LPDFQNQKNHNLGKFLRVLQRKMKEFLWPFGLYFAIWNFYRHLVHFTYIWPFGIHIFPHFGMLYQEKSGNPGPGYESFTMEEKNI